MLTVEHEHVPPGALEAVAAQGIAVHPSAAALAHTRNKLTMRQVLAEQGFPVPEWDTVHDTRSLEAFAAQQGWPVVLKTPTGGYDGKGVLVAHSLAEAREWLDHAGPLLVEQMVPFTRELAAVARSASGQAAA